MGSVARGDFLKPKSRNGSKKNAHANFVRRILKISVLFDFIQQICKTLPSYCYLNLYCHGNPTKLKF